MKTATVEQITESLAKLREKAGDVVPVRKDVNLVDIVKRVTQKKK